RAGLIGEGPGDWGGTGQPMTNRPSIQTEHTLTLSSVMFGFGLMVVWYRYVLFSLGGRVPRDPPADFLVGRSRLSLAGAGTTAVAKDQGSTPPPFFFFPF